MPVVGVVGTLVWDRIWSADPAKTEPVEEWGGIGYAWEAFEGVAPPGWRMRPIVKVGHDLYERAAAFLRRFRTVESWAGVREVPGRNTRVELRYVSGARRCERLEGGVPPWTFAELEPLLEGLDALYVNFITGAEMDLATLQAVRAAFRGPLYGDIHSLTLRTGPGGERSHAPLPRARDWIRAFDVAQMNEDELRVLAQDAGDPWRLAARVVGPETKLLLVTLGPRGAAYVVAPEFERWRERFAGGATGGTPTPGSRAAGSRAAGPVGGSRLETAGAVRSARVPVPPVEPGDPTGCVDVFGIACFLALLDGMPVEAAVDRANRAAALNVRHRGATGLHRFLRGELATPELLP